ncbi:MAG: type II toxin-antitoxin system RelE/ParE family toxin [Saprospiraceae bacterium]
MKVILSAKACKQLENLLDYLETNWSATTRRKFQKRFDFFISAIKTLPYSFPESKVFPNCRKCVITPQTSVYYLVEDHIIKIISVQDNRQNN